MIIFLVKLFRKQVFIKLLGLHTVIEHLSGMDKDLGLILGPKSSNKK